MGGYLRKTLVILLILLIAGANGCRPGADGARRFLATVGQTQIRSADVSYRMAIEKVYGNETATDVVVLVALVNDTIEGEVGRMCGVTTTGDELATLSRHADETSKSPEILAGVKRVFRDDRTSYERLYLGPKIINRKLRSWYSRNADIHEHKRALIEKAYSLARSGKSLEEAAQACGLAFSANEYRKTNREMPALLKEYFPQDGEFPADPMISILEAMSEGEIYKNIVEDDYGYKVIRLVQKNGAQYKLETITAKKRPFGKWFQEQAAQVGIKILNAELEKKLASKYPNVWWVKK